jgi:hypothetical protein
VKLHSMLDAIHKPFCCTKKIVLCYIVIMFFNRFWMVSVVF